MLGSKGVDIWHFEVEQETGEEGGEEEEAQSWDAEGQAEGVGLGICGEEFKQVTIGLYRFT